MTVNAFLKDQVLALSTKYKVSIAANTKNSDLLEEIKNRSEVMPVCIERKISLWQDIKAFFRLFYLLAIKKFNAVHSVTPKAGLLAMSAGFFAGIPVRIHTFTGQIWATRSGLTRFFLKTLDRILAAFATHILVDSNSQRSFLVEQGVVSEAKSRVLAKGSISGVDVTRFCPDLKGRADLRSYFSIKPDDIVFLYLGRLNKDKGVSDLAVSFSRICVIYDNIHLLIVGPDEENIKPHVAELCKTCLDRLHFVEYTNEPENYMSCADILCLPSYREGFGSVIIEAASTSIPSIASRIYGITDAVEDGVTGLLHDAGDIKQLINAMKKLIEDPELRRAMGETARIRARRDFSKEVVTSALLDYYHMIIK